MTSSVFREKPAATVVVVIDREIAWTKPVDKNEISDVIAVVVVVAIIIVVIAVSGRLHRRYKIFRVETRLSKPV